MNVLDLLFWPFLACLVLTGIHCYLGIHVVGRGVIFVDLAMAQIAFLGSAAAVFVLAPHPPTRAAPDRAAVAAAGGRSDRPDGGAALRLSAHPANPALARPADSTQSGDSETITLEDVDQLIPPEQTSSAAREAAGSDGSAADRAGRPAEARADGRRAEHTTVRYLGGFLFTLLGAALFSLGRLRHRQIPQEAVIGIIYAVSSALALVLLYEAPHDVAEQTRDMLVGRILFVDGAMVIKTAGLYLGVGLLHFFVRRPLMMISFQPEAAEAAGLSIRWWDFLFYATFGVIVTSSVQMAGILLVFSYLIVPAVCAMLFFQGIGARLWFGWVVGFLASVLGIALSVLIDIPTGASIIVTFGGFVIVLTCLSRMRGRRRGKAR